jgi:hypothetical protein
LGKQKGEAERRETKGKDGGREIDDEEMDGKRQRARGRWKEVKSGDTENEQEHTEEKRQKDRYRGRDKGQRGDTWLNSQLVRRRTGKGQRGGGDKSEDRE